MRRTPDDPSELQPEDQRIPEQEMWQAVVYQAVADATYEGASMLPLTIRVRDEARAWIEGGGTNFRYACWLAGLDPDTVQERLKELISGDRPKIGPRRPAGRSG